MLDIRSTLQPARTGRYHVSLAVDDSEIREAQRLRYKVFAEELGARLTSPLPGHDIDLYEPFCDHLLLRELDSGEVVGAYRILPPDAAWRACPWSRSTTASRSRCRRSSRTTCALAPCCVRSRHEIPTSTPPICCCCRCSSLYGLRPPLHGAGRTMPA